MSNVTVFSNKENSGLNQYWYSQKTIETLVNEIQLHGGRVAFLSTPSLYFSLTNKEVIENAVLFEYDLSFSKQIDEMFSGAEADSRKTRFVHYDYNEPEKVPMQFMGYFDYIVVDPPFITEEVWSKYASTIKFIMNVGGGGPHANTSGRTCKLMFTSVLENHNMLEAVHDIPLFIANFMPSIPHLVYQYYVFTNYFPSAFLSERNTSEIPFGSTEEDKKVLQAIQMANDLRESEIAFTSQVFNRDRSSEVPLPQPKSRQYVTADGSMVSKVESCSTTHNHLKNKNVPGYSAAMNELMDKPVEQMHWGHVPAGLTEYADGASAPPTELEITYFGEAHANALATRTLLEDFKKSVDKMQKFLDVLIRCDAKINAGDLDEAAAAALSAERAEAAKGREELLNVMSEMRRKAEVELKEDKLIIDVMEQCIASYTNVTVDKKHAQELAADATRKFKSPIFNRQKVLLANIKKYKQEFLAANKTA